MLTRHCGPHFMTYISLIAVLHTLNFSSAVNQLQLNKSGRKNNKADAYDFPQYRPALLYDFKVIMIVLTYFNLSLCECSLSKTRDLLLPWGGDYRPVVTNDMAVYIYKALERPSVVTAKPLPPYIVELLCPRLACPSDTRAPGGGRLGGRTHRGPSRHTTGRPGRVWPRVGPGGPWKGVGFPGVHMAQSCQGSGRIWERNRLSVRPSSLPGAVGTERQPGRKSHPGSFRAGMWRPGARPQSGDSVAHTWRHILRAR